MLKAYTEEEMNKLIMTAMAVVPILAIGFFMAVAYFTTFILTDEYKEGLRQDAIERGLVDGNGDIVWVDLDATEEEICERNNSLLCW